jgi:tRNA G18 (ribose-2'-O)-methylase SpoU
MYKLGAKELRKIGPTPETFKTIKRNPIYLVLDRVLDTYNIGSIFRLADAIAAEKVYICGDTEYPPSSRIHKAAVGTEEWVPWEHVEKVEQVLQVLKSKGVQIVAVEQDVRSIPLSTLPTIVKFPVALVVGHETDGVSKGVLDAADYIVEFPMFGVNKSFNVWGSAAIAAYKVLESLILNPYRPRKKVK